MTAISLWTVGVYVGLELLAYVLRRCFPTPKAEEVLRFAFSRYTMFGMEPGLFRFRMRNYNYNLPGNKDQFCEFIVENSGYLDAIRRAQVAICGGSTAFGLGCTSGATNVSGFLKNHHKVDAINLATPGYNIEQEIITLLKCLDTVRPSGVVLLSGANNLALSLPFDYHGVAQPADPNKFWNEESYGAAVNGYFFGVRHPWTEAKAIMKYAAGDLMLGRAYKALRHRGEARKPEPSNPIVHDRHVLLCGAAENYVKWLRLGSAVCQLHGTRLVVALQPYYCFGRDYSSIQSAGYRYKQNRLVDEYMLEGYELLERAIQAEPGVNYLPLYRLFGAYDVNVFTDAVHLNDEGARLAADIINNYLVGLSGGSHGKAVRVDQSTH